MVWVWTWKYFVQVVSNLTLATPLGPGVWRDLMSVQLVSPEILRGERCTWNRSEGRRDPKERSSVARPLELLDVSRSRPRRWTRHCGGKPGMWQQGVYMENSKHGFLSFSLNDIYSRKVCKINNNKLYTSIKGGTDRLQLFTMSEVKKKDKTIRGCCIKM